MYVELAQAANRDLFDDYMPLDFSETAYGRLKRHKIPDTEDAFLLRRHRLHHWAPGGYDGSQLAERDQVVGVLTPRSIVSAIWAGYVPELHDSVR